jgi:hypothetical protein
MMQATDGSYARLSRVAEASLFFVIFSTFVENRISELPPVFKNCTSVLSFFWTLRNGRVREFLDDSDFRLLFSPASFRCLFLEE